MAKLQLPEYAGELTPLQREQIYSFVDQAHQILEGTHFIEAQEFTDGELLALGMWISQFIQLDPSRLDQAFREAFEIDIPDSFHDWLATALLHDGEAWIRLRAGGRN
jgi:hypothetical protein